MSILSYLHTEASLTSRVFQTIAKSRVDFAKFVSSSNTSNIVELRLSVKSGKKSSFVKLKVFKLGMHLFAEETTYLCP